MMKFRKGDVVSVTGTVEYDFGADGEKVLFVKIKGHYQALTLSPDNFDDINLSLVRPRFDVGDRVEWPGAHGFGEIVAIHDGAAWIKQDDAGYETCCLGSLSRGS